MSTDERVGNRLSKSRLTLQPFKLARGVFDGLDWGVGVAVPQLIIEVPGEILRSETRCNGPSNRSAPPGLDIGWVALYNRRGRRRGRFGDRRGRLPNCRRRGRLARRR